VSRASLARRLLTVCGLDELGAYLVLNGMVKGSGDVKIVSEQGAKIGRQSFVHIRLATRGGAVTDIRVGGGVVPVLEGELRI